MKNAVLLPVSQPAIQPASTVSSVSTVSTNSTVCRSVGQSVL